LTTVEPGIACGRLLGGNLSMIAAVMGTAYEIDAEGIIRYKRVGVVTPQVMNETILPLIEKLRPKT